MPKHISLGNTTRWKRSAKVQRLFAVPRHVIGLAIRAIFIARAEIKIGFANVAYDIRWMVRTRGAVTS